ncbi:non-specific lipid-transfer protein 3-like [Corylus avellana]|uniref:non-specific lipid-transfer protein 3-like n=1 Tax=Corylus avellana TaxID=13451 RepID=UPI00286B8000|nr:non-specific lipid-transfer protein 3-like [Corylus avellana]
MKHNLSTCTTISIIYSKASYTQPATKTLKLAINSILIFMAASVVLKLTCLVLACMVASAPMAAEADIACNQVVSYLTPCVSYVASGGSVPAACCSGIKSLYDLAKTTADRQSVCRCLKQAVNGIPYTGYNIGLAAGLPNKCGVNLPYNINPSANCNDIK